MESEIAKNLLNLRHKINGQNMSVLVGAGFSKNVSPEFLSWGELLYDMAKELYEIKIKDEYELFKRSSKAVEPYTVFLKRKINNEINQIGYLQLVSNFIVRKGYREVVETYIEARTPKVYRETEKTFIEYSKGGGTIKQQLNEADLLLHKKLIELPWNNIYTTNYDHLLENCIQEDVTKKLENKIEELTKESSEKEEQIRDIETQLLFHTDEIEKKKQSLEILLKNEYISVSTDKSIRMGTPNETSNVEEIEREITELNIQLSKLKYDRETAEFIIKDNTTKIAKFVNLKGECFSVVKHSSELALKKNKNIIKLHGSLRNQDEQYFGFDGDTRKHYVIAKEDYETYPKTHEAFTQLMRISLLRESFCLIGFSGVDPNFLAWVGWVRDIIMRKAKGLDNGNSKEEQLDKIYLLELTKKSPSEDRRLFYLNHRIIHIPLLEDTCISFLEAESGKKITTGKDIKKEALCLLMEYLNDNVHVNKPQIAVELLHQKEYQKCWSDLPINAGWKEIKLSAILSQVDEVVKNKKNNRLPSVNFAYSHAKHTLLYFIQPYYEAVKSKEEKIKVLRLFDIALRDQFLPYFIYNSHMSFDKIIQWALKCNLLEDDYRLIQIKDAVIRNDVGKVKNLFRISKVKAHYHSNELTHQRALHAAFNLDFTSLKSIFTSWESSSDFVTRKAGLLSICEIDDAIKLIKATEFNSIQEKLYGEDLLDFIINARKPYRRESKYKRSIEATKNEGMKTVDDNINYLIEEVKRDENDKIEIKPYGDNKFKVGNSTKFSNIHPDLQSIQFFNILIETGTPLVLEGIYFQGYKDVYPVIRQSYQFIPFTVLFFSLQYNDTDFLRRLGQDYAYSKHLIDDNIVISKNIQKAYFDSNTPNRYKKSSLIFLSELLVVLEPENWQDFYYKYWNYALSQMTLFVDLRFKENPIIAKGLRYIKEPHAISEIICDCIDNLDKEDGNTSIQYLYELAQNYWLQKQAIQIKDIKLTGKISKLINDIPKLNSSALFALGNIYVLLNSAEKKEVKSKLSETNFLSISNERVWSVILYFTEGNLQVLSKIKIAILNHPKLWSSGITEKGGSIPYDYISLYKLRKTRNYSKGIEWTGKEKKLIFSRLVKSFNSIQTFIQKRSDIDGYKGILEEMQYFLEDEMTGSAVNVLKIRKEVNELYSSQKGYSNIMDGLISEDQSKIIWALNEISKEIYQNRTVKDAVNYIELVINKLMVRSNTAMGACLSYVSEWIFDFRDESILRQYHPHILKLIEKYSDYYSDEIDLPFVKEKIAKLAIVLKSWKIRNKLVDDQIEEAKNSRFKNLQYALRDINV